jgi:DNA-binding CsgD family transcriptional regulator
MKNNREMVEILKKEGLSNAQISLTLGISRQRVCQILKECVGGRASVRKTEALLSNIQVARFFNVHVNTIRRWSDAGLLPFYRIGFRGDRRFRWSDIIYALQHSLIKNLPRAMSGVSRIEIKRNNIPRKSHYPES